jgi:hypothetical protein
VVPTALKTTVGGRERVEIMGPHFEVSGSRIVDSLGEVCFGRRREKVVIDVKAWSLRRVVRMLLPTAPVLPNIAAVAIA